MDWQVAIDIKAWESDSSMLIDSLSFAKHRIGLKVLFADHIYHVISSNHLNSWLICNLLGNVQKDFYSKRPEGVCMAFSPNISVGLNPSEEDETEDVTYSMLQLAEPPHKIYEIAVARPNGTTDTNLTITGGSSSKNVNLIITSNGISLEQFFAHNHPKLQQAKHISQQTRYIGGGKIASTFKAWNPNDESYAIELLNKAFGDSGSPTLPPTPIYTWDSRNENYVKFMHSGNWEYHGYDLEDFNEVPHEIKERYNHWKK